MIKSEHIHMIKQEATYRTVTAGLTVRASLDMVKILIFNVISDSVC